MATFPISPINGEIATVANVAYQYNSATNSWRRVIGNISALSVSGNVNSGNLLTTGYVSATGNITGNYIIGNGSQLTGLPASYSNANAVAYGEAGWAGNIIPSSNAAYSLGTAALQWKSLYVSNTTVYIGDVPLSTEGNTLTVAGNTVLTSSSNTSNITGNLTATGYISAVGNVTGSYIIGNGSQLTGLPEQYGNSNVATYLASGTVSTDIKTTAAISATGNITGNYFIGNGSQLTGLPEQYGNSNVAAYLPTYTGNLSAGNISATGNIVGGNIVTGGSSGNISGANVITANVFSASGNITGSYIIGNGSQLTGLPAGYANSNAASYFASGNVSTDIITTANITGNYIIGNGSTLSSITGANVSGTVANATYATSAGTAGTVTTNAQPNITSVGTLTSVTITGNTTAGNLLTGGLISATGNATAGNVLTGGQVSATANITGGNVLTAGIMSSTGNTTAGNVLTSGLVSATGNITGNNIIGNVLATTVSTSGNVTGGNILTSGLLSATGAGYFGNSLSVVGNLTVSGNINYQDVTDLVVGDPLIYIGANNTADLVDLGLVASANVSGIYQHLGLVRNHSTGVWGLFGNVVAEPTTVIDWANAVYQPLLSGTISSTGNVNATGLVSATGNVVAGNVNTAGLLTATGNVTAGNVNTAGLITATGNITGGNVNTAGLITATGNISAGNIRTAGLITATGNVTGNYFIGNGSQLTGVLTISSAMTWTSQANTPPSGVAPGSFWYDSYSGVKYQYTNDGTANIWVDQSFPTSFSTLAVTGNATIGGNLGVTGTLTYGNISTTGNVDGGNLRTSGLITATGNATAGNILTAGLISATGNITAGNVSATSLTGTLATAAQTNITSVGTLTGLTINGTMISGNASSSRLRFTESANVMYIQSGNGVSGSSSFINFATYSTTTTTMAVDLANTRVGIANTAPGHTLAVTGNAYVTANITGGNLSVGSGIINSGNINASNIAATGLLSVTGLTTASGYIMNAWNLGATDISVTAIGGGSASTGRTLLGWNRSGGAGEFDLIVNPDGGSQGGFSVYHWANSLSNTTSLLFNINGSTSVVSAVGNIVGANILTAGIMSSTGNAIHGNMSVSTGTVTVGNIVNANGNGVGNIGSSSLYFNTVFAKATSAQYADLAEMYVADRDLEPGTVVEFGGDYEVRASQTSHSTQVAGIVSTNPSYLMNAAQPGDTVIAVALTGRVPCRVIGQIRKGDRLVAGEIEGVATVLNMEYYEPGCIIGKALENYDSNQVGVIEVAVGRT